MSLVTYQLVSQCPLSVSGYLSLWSAGRWSADRLSLRVPPFLAFFPFLLRSNYGEVRTVRNLFISFLCVSVGMVRDHAKPLA